MIKKFLLLVSCSAVIFSTQILFVSFGYHNSYYKYIKFFTIINLIITCVFFILNISANKDHPYKFYINAKYIKSLIFTSVFTIIILLFDDKWTILFSSYVNLWFSIFHILLFLSLNFLPHFIKIDKIDIANKLENIKIGSILLYILISYVILIFIADIVDLTR